MERKRLDGLNVVRALAFLLIFISHTSIPNSAFGGPAGVEIFFLLSGFLMFWNYVDRELDFSFRGRLQFAWHKVRKLYPLYLLTFFVGVILDVQLYGLNGIIRLVLTAVKSVLNLLLLQSWVPKASFYFSFNSVAWYLSVILFLYFMFPRILRRLNDYKRRKSAGVAIVCIVILQMVISFCVSLVCRHLSISEDITKWFTYINPVYRLGDFIIGCNLGYMFKTDSRVLSSDRSWHGWQYTCLEIASLLLLILEGIFFNSIGSDLQDPCPQLWWIWSLLFLPTSGLIIYIYSLGGGLISRLNGSPVRNIVALSPYAFLMHQLVIRIVDSLDLKQYIQLRGYCYIEAAICLVITIVLCMLYRKLETHIKFYVKKHHIRQG